MRWLTAGESHGEALLGILEGLPSGICVTTPVIAAALARRRLGHGRGARMSFEADQLKLLGGIWRGYTTGAPIAIEIGNSEWPKWAEVMSPDLAPTSATARAEPLTRPRPGHADLPGMIKYAQSDVRAILERSSARETAAKVAIGAVAAAFLTQALGVRLVSHVRRIGPIQVADDAPVPRPDDVELLDANPVRCTDPIAALQMVTQIDAAAATGDTLGGVVEVLAYGLPVGLGSHVQADRKLDARLAGEVMGIQAVKGVEIGDGFASAARPGSSAHDEIGRGPDGRIERDTNRAGGIEGGMSNGQTLRLRAAIKPIPSLPRALRTIDTVTGQSVTAITQRSDTCAVPAAAIVAEAAVALVLAAAALEKFGGDSLAETKRNLAGYQAGIPEVLR